VRYLSTRGEAPPLDFAEATLAGLAPDGGLYVPEQWPRVADRVIAGWAGRPYADLAVNVLREFVAGTIPEADLARIARDAYDTFRHPAVVPLVQLAPDTFVLELFHGPTLAFKDLAMQLIAGLMDYVLKTRGERATIVAATSGDTGGAAVEAFRGRDQVDLIVLFPDGRISEVQRRMMTTVTASNVHALSIEGTFDDCQAIVKGLFGHRAFRERTRLSAVNSINWARIAAQVVYYFAAAIALGAPYRPLSFTVPTGNFGDIFAGYVAKRMGLPIEQLIIATNVNDILVRSLETGVYQPREVVATTSPSMDIQISSNFERLLFDAYERHSPSVRSLMDSLAQSRSFTLAPDALSMIRATFAAGRADDSEVAHTIASLHRTTGYLVDPHTAVGVAVAGRHNRRSGVPMVVLSTAHPAKFPQAVASASGFVPALPDWLADLPTRPERLTVLPADQSRVERFVESASRATREGAAA